MKFSTLTYSFAILLLLIGRYTLSGQSANRIFQKYENSGNKISIYVSDGQYEIVPFDDKIMHVTFFPTHKKSKSLSFAVESKPNFNNYSIIEKPDQLVIKLPGITAEVKKSPFSISYVDPSGKLLLSEKNGFIESNSGQSVVFEVSKDEVFYGGGARGLGMNRRGNKLKLYNEPHYGYENRAEVLNFSLPVFISSKKYAILFDNSSLGYLDLDSEKKNQVVYSTTYGQMNYYILCGSDWYDLTKQYTTLTGTQPIPPRWAFGNFSSRFGYHSQRETEETINRFITDSIPVDAVVIDIYWFGKEIKGTLGNLEWDTDSFPNPDKMIKSFKEKGIKTILVTEPFILNTSKKWNEAVQKNILCTDSAGNPIVYNFYFGNTGLIDLYKPQAREWFWNVYRKFTLQGIDGWWGDLGEPENHPSHVMHAAGSADELHNAYGHEWAKLIFEGYKQDFPNQRPFILMRAGYAGSQKYGIIPWTGDVSRSWGGLVLQPEISLQMGMQGIAYMHSDLGGFSEVKKYDSELYTRWLQYGVFQPIFRPHAFEAIPSEPVFQPADIKTLAKQSIELRYRLLPYIYNMAFENSMTGRPLMIPLFFNEPTNETLLSYDKAYMWGDAFLVSPVTEKGKKSQKIYFPKGFKWYDFFGNEIYEGGKTFEVTLKPEYIPVFVKGGSFIPLVNNVKNTENYSLKNFELHYYCDLQIPKTKYNLYNDDGITPDSYAKRKYEIFEFEAIHNDKVLLITLLKSNEGLSPVTDSNLVKIVIHHLDKKPGQIRINGEKISAKDWTWKPLTRSLEMWVDCSKEKVKLKIDKY